MCQWATKVCDRVRERARKHYSLRHFILKFDYNIAIKEEMVLEREREEWEWKRPWWESSTQYCFWYRDQRLWFNEYTRTATTIAKYRNEQWHQCQCAIIVRHWREQVPNIIQLKRVSCIGALKIDHLFKLHEWRCTLTLTLSIDSLDDCYYYYFRRLHLEF